MHIEVECKGCHTRYRVDASLAGRTAACKHCGKRFIVPYRSNVVELGEDEAVPIVPKPVSTARHRAAHAPAPAPAPVPAPARVPVDPPPAVERAGAEAGREAEGPLESEADFDDPSLLPLSDVPAEERVTAAPRRAEPLIPQVLTDVWIPLLVVALAAGCAGYAALTRAIHAPNAVVALGMLGLGVVLYVLLAMPLTIRGLQAAGDSLGFQLPNAYWLQTLAAYSVPSAAMALGYFKAGPRGAVMGGLLGLFAVWPLMTLMYRLHVLRAASAALAGAICYVFSLGVVAAVVAGVSVVISLAGLALPWQKPEVPIVVVEAPVERPKPSEPAPEPAPAPVEVVDVPHASDALVTAISPADLAIPKAPPPWVATVDAPEPSAPWPTDLHHTPEVRGPVVLVRSIPTGPCVGLVDRDSCDIYDLRSRRRVGFIKEPLQTTGTMKLISPDGAHLVIDRSGTVRGLEVWSTAIGSARLECPIRSGPSAPQPLGFIGNDQLAVTTFDERGKPWVQVWAVKTGQMLRQIEAALGPVMAMSPRGRFLAIVSPHERRLQVYDLEKGERTGEREIQKPDGAAAFATPTPLAISFSRDGMELALLLGEPVPASARLLIWSMADGKVVQDVTVQGISVTMAAPMARRVDAMEETLALEWLPDGEAFRIGNELFDRYSGQKYYTIPTQTAGELVGRPVRMVTNFHVLQEFAPDAPAPLPAFARNNSPRNDRSDKPGKVIYRCYPLPRPDVEAKLRAVRPAGAAPASQSAPLVTAGDAAPSPSTAPAVLAAGQSVPPEQQIAREKLERGMAELSAGRDREAQVLFRDGLAALGKPSTQRLDDDLQVNLHHALAVAHVRLGEIPKAKQAMDRVRAATKSNRSIVLNDAYLDVLTKQNVPRAIATLDELFASGAVDEDALNLYGQAVSRMEADTGTRSRAAALWAKYREYEAKLVPPAPGLRRWGTRWLTPAEFAPIDQQIRQAEANKQQFRARIASLDQSLVDAKVEAVSANAAYQAARSRNLNDHRLPALAREASRANAEVGRIGRELDKAREQLHNAPSGQKPSFEGLMPFTPTLELQLK